MGGDDDLDSLTEMARTLEVLSPGRFAQLAYVARRLLLLAELEESARSRGEILDPPTKPPSRS
jgi:hypothetical protein